MAGKNKTAPAPAPAVNWADNDDAAEASAPVAASAPAPAPAGEEVEPVVAEPAAAQAEPEKDDFPADTDKAYALLRELSKFKRLGPKPTPEQRAGNAKHRRLRKHILALQQGLPHVQTDAHSVGAFIGLSLTERTRWTLKARTDLDFKKLLAAHDALAKENAELKKLNE